MGSKRPSYVYYAPRRPRGDYPGSLRERIVTDLRNLQDPSRSGNFPYRRDYEPGDGPQEPSERGVVRFGRFTLRDGNPPDEPDSTIAVGHPQPTHQSVRQEETPQVIQRSSVSSNCPAQPPTQGLFGFGAARPAPGHQIGAEAGQRRLHRPPTPPQHQANKGGRPFSSEFQGVQRPTTRAAYTAEEENFLVFANARWPGSSSRDKKAAALDEWLVSQGQAGRLPYRSSQSSWEHYDYTRKSDSGRPARQPLKDRWRETYDTPEYQARRSEMAAFFNKNGSPK